jgi:hypothetical protein
MVQLDLFDQPQLSRRTDKPTSHESADSTRVKLGWYWSCILLVLDDSELTAREIGRKCAVRFGNDADTYRKRMAEMVRERLIEELPTRVCTITGKSVTGYRRITS